MKTIKVSQNISGDLNADEFSLTAPEIEINSSGCMTIHDRKSPDSSAEFVAIYHHGQWISVIDTEKIAAQR